MTSRFLIGIDLGTTHTALAYRDLESDNEEPQILSISGLSLLPSVVKGISSSKSWLFAASHHKDEPLLPLDSQEDKDRLTPSQVATALITILKEAWAKKFPDHPLEEQKIALGCPASFNERARKLTLKGAEKAGVLAPYLIEEPLAAFYCFLREQPDYKQEELLVIDCGGGTTDFTLIKKKGEGFERTAVGDHLLIGGDNMDLALEANFEVDNGKKLKESAKQDSDVYKSLVEGFFPYEPLEVAAAAIKTTGLKRGGLPYPSEPSIIRHLARFIKTHQLNPSAILFTGGVFKATCLRDAVTHTFSKWVSEKQVHSFYPKSFDFAVAKGAVSYLEAKLGLRSKVEGGSPKTYFLEIRTNQSSKVVVILPKGQPEGSKIVISRSFKMKAGEPLDFPLWSSHTRVGDKAGDVLDIDPEEMTLESRLSGLLKMGKTQDEIEVFVQGELTEWGVLTLSLKAPKTGHVWELEFSSRSSTKSQSAPSLFEAKVLEEIKDKVENAFLGADPDFLLGLGRRLEEYLDIGRAAFSLPVLRAIWEALKKVESRRKASDVYDSAWWHWAGFSLRPGLGYPLDETRVEAFWKIFLSSTLSQKGEESCLIAMRRVAPGLSKGQQNEAYKRFKKSSPEKTRLIGALEKLKREEKLRNLEELFSKVIEDEGSPLLKAQLWTVARLGARRPICQDPSVVLPFKSIEAIIVKWIKEGKLSATTAPYWEFVWRQWFQETGIRELDIPKPLITKIINKMALFLPVDRLLKVRYQGESFSEEDKGEFLGDQLPLGLELEL